MGFARGRKAPSTRRSAGRLARGESGTETRGAAPVSAQRLSSAGLAVRARAADDGPPGVPLLRRAQAGAGSAGPTAGREGTGGSAGAGCRRGCLLGRIRCAGPRARVVAIRRRARWRVHPAPLQTGTGLRPRIHGGLPAAPTSPATAPAARPRAAATPDGRTGTTRRWVQAKPRCGPLQTVTSQARRITPTIMIRICALGSGGWSARRGAGRAHKGRGWPICSRSTPWVDNGRRGRGRALGRAPRSDHSRSSRVQMASCSRFTGNLGAAV